MNTGCLILAGGKSRRIGYRKSSLRLNGTTFLDKLIFELRDFPEILVSVDDAARHPEIPYSMIDEPVFRKKEERHREERAAHPTRRQIRHCKVRS